MTDDSCYVRITANPAHDDAPWWAAARASNSAPSITKKLLAPDGPRTLIVMWGEADAFRSWAASLPGWHVSASGGRLSPGSRRIDSAR